MAIKRFTVEMETDDAEAPNQKDFEGELSEGEVADLLVKYGRAKEIVESLRDYCETPEDAMEVLGIAITRLSRIMATLDD